MFVTKIETGFVFGAMECCNQNWICLWGHFWSKVLLFVVELKQPDDNVIDEVDYDEDDEMTNDDKVEHLETISSACARTAVPICTDFLHRDVWEKGCKHNYDDLQH